MGQQSYTAGGDIRPARFVKISGEDTVTACGAGEFAIGVSRQHVRSTPLPESTQVNNAIAGDPITPFAMGETCYIEAGGNITAGAFLKSGAAGVAVVAGNDEFFNAIARAPAASGAMVKAYLINGRTAPGT
jgi:hypothetical protein